MRQQIREMLATHAHYTQMEPLLTRLQAKMEEDIKARQDKLDTDRVKIDVDQEKRKADIKAFNEIMERREDEKKPMMRRRWPSGKMIEKKRKADFEKMMAKRKADQELAARLEAIHNKIDANQMRLEPKRNIKGRWMPG
jgi:hypothetical protein